MADDPNNPNAGRSLGGGSGEPLPESWANRAASGGRIGGPPTGYETPNTMSDPCFRHTCFDLVEERGPLERVALRRYQIWLARVAPLEAECPSVPHPKTTKRKMTHKKERDGLLVESGGKRRP